ncbi:hypothetical protein D9M68_552060 [compost metagenome]
MHQGLQTGQAFWAGHIVVVVEQAVGLRVTQGTGHDRLGLGLNRRETATALHDQLTVGTLHAAGTVAHHVIPDGLQAVLGNRERHAGLLIIRQTDTAGH